MSTITKEFTKEQLIEFATAILDVEKAMAANDLSGREARASAAIAEIALASLEAEPVAYMYKDRLHTDARFSLHTRFGNWSQEDINEYEITEIPLYTAPPAPVSVPDEANPENIEILASTLAPCGVTYQWDRDECNAAADSWNACRAAMLQGAEIAESPTTMQTAPALDSSPKIAESPSGNSPVIPDGWVMVPEEPTHEMLEAGDEQFGTYDVYRRMIAASPQQK